MALVKQASPELVGCQAHVKERSISPTCVGPVIDEGGEREGLPLLAVLLPQRPRPLVEFLQFPHCNPLKKIKLEEFRVIPEHTRQ